ncbi:MAG: hypothetical protein L0228_19165 [Planctomycetes bacterium]|nr:hypothetical protein [Planctomycetota bacterium]
MERFEKVHQDRVIGVLSGFDRILFRGTLRSLAYANGLCLWLSAHGVLLKNFKAFAQMISTRMKQHAEQLAAEAGRPFQYIASAAISKEELAAAING